MGTLMAHTGWTVIHEKMGWRMYYCIYQKYRYVLLSTWKTYGAHLQKIVSSELDVNYNYM